MCWIGNVQRLGALLLSAIGLSLGFGPLGVACAQLISPIVVGVSTLTALHKNHRQLAPSVQRLNLSTARLLIAPASVFSLPWAANLLALQAPVIILARTFGGTSVAVFATYRTLANTIRQISSIIMQAASPEITTLHARGHRESLRSLHRVLVFFSFPLTFAICGALWLYGPEVLNLWTRGKLGYDAGLLRALLLVALLQTAGGLFGMFPLATDQFRRACIGIFLTSCMSVLGGYLFLDTLGATAFPAFGLMAEFTLSAFLLHEAAHVIGEDLRRHVLQIAIATACTVATVATVFIAAALVADLWWPLAVVMSVVISSGITSVALWRLILKDTDRSVLRDSVAAVGF
jgi:O-antigen/teichoic acid export membrane protein